MDEPRHDALGHGGAADVAVADKQNFEHRSKLLESTGILRLLAASPVCELMLYLAYPCIKSHIFSRKSSTRSSKSVADLWFYDSPFMTRFSSSLALSYALHSFIPLKAVNTDYHIFYAISLIFCEETCYFGSLSLSSVNY